MQGKEGMIEQLGSKIETIEAVCYFTDPIGRERNVYNIHLVWALKWDHC